VGRARFKAFLLIRILVSLVFCPEEFRSFCLFLISFTPFDLVFFVQFQPTPLATAEFRQAPDG
jgi:hypothetical protein